MVTWDVEDCADAEPSAELVSRAYLKERISRRRIQPLILHPDNYNGLAAAFRTAIAFGDVGSATEGAWCDQILLQATNEKRQLLHRIAISQFQKPTS